MPTKKVLLIAEPSDFPKEAIEILKKKFTVYPVELSKKELSNRLQSATALWVRLKFNLDKKLLAKANNLRYIVSPTTGLTHIDTSFCKEAGIKIISLKEEKQFLKSITPTAELTVGLAITLMRKILPAASSASNGLWERDNFRGNELNGKTVGIIGYGRLGVIAAKYFNVFNCNVIVHDKNKKAKAFKNVSIKELLKCSDIISIHVDENDSSFNLLSASEFLLMKPSAVLINTSRGSIVNEFALLKALKRNMITGAAIDVMKDEFNISRKNPLIDYASKNENLLITPHIGGNTYESFLKTHIYLARKLVKISSFG